MKISGSHKSIIIGLAFITTLVLKGHAAEEVKPLQQHPKVNRIWMGAQEGSVRPSAYIQYRAQGDGYLELEAKDGQMLKKDERWAVMDPKQVGLEIEALELEEKKLELELRKLRKDAWQNEAQLTLELREMMSKRDALLEASQSAEIPKKLRQQAAGAAEKMKAQIAVQFEMLEPGQLKQAAEVEVQAAELALARKKHQMLLLEKRSFFTTQFDGQLRYSDQILKKIEGLEEGKPRIWVLNNDPIAAVVDDSAHEIVVAASGPVMNSVPSKELMVLLLQSKTGKMIEGHYARTEEEDAGLEIRRKFIFSVDKTSIEDAKQSMGQRNMVHVYRVFERDYYLVHKRNIAFAAPDVLSKGGWVGLARHLWPKCQVVQVGPQSLLIESKHED